MISFVQNTVRILQYVREEVVVHVSSQLRWRGIVGSVQAELDSTSYRCFVSDIAYRLRW